MIQQPNIEQLTKENIFLKSELDKISKEHRSPHDEQLMRENIFLKNKLDEIFKEHSRPHESEDVYAANMSLLLQEIFKDLRGK